MKPIHTIGIDIAKRVSQIHAIDRNGKVVLKRRLARADVIKFFESIPPCVVGIEATSGANHLAQRLTAIGHTVRLMQASYVKPYVKTNKNDANDAEAVCEAVRRPNMRFVPAKSQEQQSILFLHRTRALLTRQKGSLTNAIKALLTEFGEVVPRNSAGTTEAFSLIEDRSRLNLPEFARSSLEVLKQHLQTTNARIKECGILIKKIHKENRSCVLLATIPGIASLASTALVASIGDGTAFASGRGLAAWLGLVPQQYSSGERISLGKISKRGDPYLRRLFVMAAMSIMRVGTKSRYAMVHWAMQIATRKRYMTGVVALANKLARIAWVVLVRGEPFRDMTATRP